MEIEVWLFVLTLLAAFLVGSGLVALIARRRLRSSRAQGRETLDKLKRAETDLHDAEVDGRRQANEIDQLGAAVAAGQAALAEADADLASAREELRIRDAGATTSERQLADFRQRFNDIVGLESEIATLRVIAARVPELESQLAGLTAGVEGDTGDHVQAEDGAEHDDATIIDLRNCDHQQAK